MNTEKIRSEINEVQEKMEAVGSNKLDFNMPVLSKEGLILTVFIVLGVIIGLIAYITWWAVN